MSLLKPNMESGKYPIPKDARVPGNDPESVTTPGRDSRGDKDGSTVTPEANTQSRRRSLIVVSLLLAVFVLLVFLPVKDFGFVDIDDDVYVTRNSIVKNGLTWQGIRWAFTTTHAANWHPLTWVSHMVDCQLFGLNAGAHHQISELIHILNSVLLLLLLYKMTGALWKSAFVAALFALHPLHVESVVWISERKDLLSTCFGFLAILFYVFHVRKRNWALYIVSLFCFALSLMAKPMMVTLPFLLLLFDFWPLERIPQNGRRIWQRVRAVPGLVVEKAPFLL